MLDNLVIAVESESQVIDIGRVSGFMQKVRQTLGLFFSRVRFFALTAGATLR